MIRLNVAQVKPVELEVLMTAAAAPGPAPVLINKTITENGVYAASADGADGYRQVTAEVPNTYSASDEGKVVENGALEPQTAKTITENGTYDTTKNNSVTAAVPNTYSAADEGKVVENGALVSQTAKTITANGTYDTTKNNSVTAEVPNTYTAADEGKVVDDGALVSQTSATYTTNDTYDTTLISEVVVNVAGSAFDYFDFAQPSGALESLTATGIKPYFFAGRTGITSINAPNLEYLEANMCDGCTGLQSVNFGGARWRNYNGNNFKGCTSLVGFVQKIKESAWGTPSGSIFEGCTGLQYLDLNFTGTNGQSGFKGCTALTKVILRKTGGVVGLANINWFENTPFASDGAGGTLYVPSALIASYQAASNWSTILGYANNSIVAIEGSAYENYYADGTPIS